MSRIAHPAPQAGFEAPFDMLHACHERVQRTLDLLARLQLHLQTVGCDDNARQAARDVLRYFDVAAPLHHQDEELHVFPLLLQSGDAVQCELVHRLVQDHRDMEKSWAHARAVLHLIADDTTGTLAVHDDQTQVLDAFAALYAQHLVSEENLAYPAARTLLSDEALQAMSQDMMTRRGVRPNSNSA